MNVTAKKASLWMSDDKRGFSSVVDPGSGIVFPDPGSNPVLINNFCVKNT